MKFLTVDKNGLFFSFIAVFLFACNSTGFDFYSHSVSYYFYDSVINSSDLLFGHVVLPRYLMLSYIYEFFSRLGIPLGWVSMILIVYPVNKIAVGLINNATNVCGKSYSVYVCVLMGFSFLLCFFYSGLSLVLLWFLAYLITKKRVFLFGGVLHPVGIVIFLAGLIFLKRDLLKFFAILLCTLLLFYVCSQLSLFTASANTTYRYDLNFKTVSIVLTHVYERKANELMGLAVLLGFSVLAKAKLLESVNVFNRVYIPSILLKTGSIGICLIFFFLMIDRPSLINSLIFFDYNDVIYASWFDWGAKDLRVEHGELYMRRYQPL
ncbi:hypothetical protein J8L98_04080 [Pseudoalteromonas sp. MMG013]|uniref:hypothetical protein n=1 Tax=Pseudoalteromonas sp. MMG013 TaxID=2822687 RepID=UPI001B38E8CA|nr:hypothetical protein [Pseudoalteromonas sp. MMG013]MBQ4860874.1 hypothetical protein [Pseudoalteromonas sp. MMG013]